MCVAWQSEADAFTDRLQSTRVALVSAISAARAAAMVKLDAEAGDGDGVEVNYETEVVDSSDDGVSDGDEVVDEFGAGVSDADSASGDGSSGAAGAAADNDKTPS